MFLRKDVDRIIFFYLLNETNFAFLNHKIWSAKGLCLTGIYLDNSLEVNLSQRLFNFFVLNSTLFLANLVFPEMFCKKFLLQAVFVMLEAISDQLPG